MFSGVKSLKSIKLFTDLETGLKQILVFSSIKVKKKKKEKMLWKHKYWGEKKHNKKCLCYSLFNNKKYFLGSFSEWVKFGRFLIPNKKAMENFIFGTFLWMQSCTWS